MKYYLILFLFVPLLVFAQQEQNKLIKKGIDIDSGKPMGLHVGDDAPLIQTVSLDGRIINAKEILRKKEIVVIFYRGEWCPVCNRYLSNLQDSLTFITDKLAEVIVIGPEKQQYGQELMDKVEADFILIPDTTMKYLNAFDVLFQVTKSYHRKIKLFLGTDIAEQNDQEKAQLPVPATYIINRQGKIKWRHFDYNYSNRASVQSIIEQLENPSGL